MLTMNPDEIKSALGQLATAVCFLLVGAGVITTAQSSEIAKDVGALAGAIGMAIPAVLGLVNIGGSIWRHWNLKKVPEAAVVVTPATQPPPPPASGIAPQAIAALRWTARVCRRSAAARP